MTDEMKPTMKDPMDEIETTLALGKGEKVNLCYALYRIICRGDKEDQPRILRHAVECFDGSESSEELEIEAVITRDEADMLRERYGEIVDQMLELLINNNPSENDFYEQLWATINNPIFSTEKVKVFALYYVLIDKRIPYFEVERGLKMSNDDFTKRVRALRRATAKIRFLLARRFSQRTEQADLILREITRAPEPDNIVLVAEMIARLVAERDVALVLAKRRR